MTKISYFKTVKTTRPADVDLMAILNSIRLEKFKEQIDAIRAATPDQQEILKKELPGVTFGGTFSKRAMAGLLQASGLMCLDFDTEGYVCPDSLKPYVFASFRSPRGGLKAIVRIPVVQNDSEFKELYGALEAEYPDLDPSGKDISRICFISADSGLYLNEQAQVWEKRVKIESKAPKSGLSMEGDVSAPSTQIQGQTNWMKVATGLRMIKSMSVGNRHQNCLKAGQLMGGYIATGEIAMADIEVLVREIEAVSTEPKDHVKAFMDGVAYGKKLPLTSKRGEEDVYKVRKGIKAEFEASAKMGDIYYSMEDDAIQKEIEEKWKNGTQRGVATGWPALDSLFSILLGYITIIYGSPFMGKSIFTMNLAMNLAKMFNWNFCLFTPEMGTPAEVLQTLLQIYVGKDLDNTYSNRMSREEMEAGKKFIQEHFIILDNEESGADIDIESLCLYVDFLERKFGKKIHGLIVDPLIELQQMQADMRDDIYWNQELRKCRVMAKRSMRHVFLIHHSRDPGKPSGKDLYGNNIYPQPSPYDVAFGQTFYRKAFFMINVWYHYSEGAQFGEEIELKPLKKFVKCGYSYIKVVKAKPEGAGQRGEVELRFIKAEHRYADDSAAPARLKPVVRDFSESQKEIKFDVGDEPIQAESPEWLEENG